MYFDTPDDLIESNYTQAPHTIDFYRNMMCSYLGIMGEVINNIDVFPQQILNYSQTPKGKTRMTQSFYGKASSNLQKFYTYELLDVSNECWTPGCAGTYFIFEISPTEYVIVFNVGFRRQISEIELSNRNIQYFNKFLGKILGLVHRGAERILLCGHSNGFVSATLTSIMLMCLSDPTFASVFADKDILTRSLYQNVYGLYNPELFFGLTDKLCVCGTAGFPVLFDDPETFDYYFQTLNGRYLHIGLALKQESMGKVDLWVDYFMHPQSQRKVGGIYLDDQTPLNNYFYHIYSYPYGYFLDTINKKPFYKVGDIDEHVLYAEPDLVEYDGLNQEDTQFFKEEYTFEMHMFNFYRVLLAPIFC
jgi:hypothetical protein